MTVFGPALVLSRIALAAASLSILCGTITEAAAAAPRNWTDYRNERYGLTLRYPADLFVVERTAEAGDGQVFVAPDTDARLLVGALPNASRYTPATYQDYIARHSYSQYQIGYRRLSGSWFVLSGEGNGKVFYEKVIFSCGGRLINSFAMIYPSEQRQVFDPVVEQIEDTFRAARDCERVGLPPLPAERQQARRRSSRPAGEHRERSALADRIARARGKDVLVILRRTGPPYDRKILRGYVSGP